MVLGSPAVVVTRLTHRYAAAAGPLTVLDELDLTVAPGEHVAIVGPSGSGKSTLLALIGGLERPQSGQVVVAGRDLALLTADELARFRSASVGFVFQHFGLLDALTAVENIELAATLLGRPRAARRQAARELLSHVGLSAQTSQYPSTLSGGERQRVAIARALVNQPGLILADEPTGNLDASTAGAVADLLTSTTESHGTALVIVTHDPVMAARADRILVLSSGRLHVGSDA